MEDERGDAARLAIRFVFLFIDDNNFGKMDAKGPDFVTPPKRDSAISYYSLNQDIFFPFRRGL